MYDFVKQLIIHLLLLFNLLMLLILFISSLLIGSDTVGLPFQDMILPSLSYSITGPIFFSYIIIFIILFKVFLITCIKIFLNI